LIYLIKIGFLDFRLVDILDILAVSFLLFQVYKLMKGSVAIRIFLGFLFLYLIYLVVRAIDMELLSAILGQFMGVGVIAVIILFQQEIRKFLLMLGKTTFFNRENFFKHMWSREEITDLNITQVVEAAKSMGGSNTGALIVFSRDTELKFYAESGDIIDAEVSKRLLLSIFNKYSPLHDGAVIIHKNRIKAARCVLPVTERDNLPAQFGMRHRAAVGMSEVTDTLILVVSEETGQMSVAKNGIVFHNLSGQEIREKIGEYLTEEKKGFGQKLQDMLKDEINEMEKKEKEEKKVSAPSS
jgi:diadenylate cyclase